MSFPRRFLYILSTLGTVTSSLPSTLSTVTSSPPCIQVTHSDCGDDDWHLFLEMSVPDLTACQTVCDVSGSRCKFSLFDYQPYARGNCRLYDESLSKFISSCNETAGPKAFTSPCNVEHPPDDDCQIYRYGKCDFQEPQESASSSSWETCQAACQANSLCNYWQFLKEDKLCMILYEEEKKCAWEFSPRVPSEDECDGPPPTTSKPPITTTTDQQDTCKQKGRNPIPGVDCSHDFYCCEEVGENSPKLCTCSNGLWYDQTTRYCLWGDLLDPECSDKRVGHNIDEFTRDDHTCSDGTICVSVPATTSKPPITTTDQQEICKQKGKNPITGVDCSHNFYCCDEVGDKSPKLCTCSNHLWYQQEFEGCFWGDMFDPPCDDKTVGHNIDEFTRADHICSDGSICV